MILQIVRYNIHYKINRILYLTAFLIFIGSMFIDFGHYKKEMNESIFFKVLIFTPVTIWGIHLCMKRYTDIGVCLTDHHSITLKYKTGMIKEIELTELLFIYDGYRGKSIMAWNILFAGRHTKEGANNYLVFNNDYSNKVQIFLTKQKYKDLLNTFAELETAGVKTQKVHYAVFGFRNIINKIKPIK